MSFPAFGLGAGFSGVTAGVHSWPCSGQGTSDRRMLGLYRALYRGDIGATIQLLRERYSANDTLLSYDRRDTGRNYPVLNDLRVIVDRRIDAMPNTFDWVHEDEGARDAIAEWSSSRITSRGLSLYAALLQIIDDQERDGNTAIVLSMGDTGPVIAIRDTGHLEVDVDARTGEFRRVRFAWEDTVPSADGKTDTIQYVEIIDDTSITFLVNGEGEPEPHGLGFLPVIIIPRQVEHGSPIGTSGVSELLSAYLHVLWTEYLLNRANKLEGFGLYCPATQEVQDALLSDEDTTGLRDFKIAPGGFYPMMIQKVGGNVRVDSIVSQLESAMDTLYRLGKVRRQRDQGADMRSGKAMLIDTHELRDYTQRKLVLLRWGLERLADMWAWAIGATPVGQPSGFTVEFPPLDDDDPSEITRRAELWLKAWEAETVTADMALRAWQRLGMIDEDADIEALVSELEEEKEARESAAMERMAATLEARKPPEEEAIEGPPPEPPTMDEAPDG